MGVYSRDGGQWVDSIPFSRDASAWTSSASSLWSRDGGAWVLIYPTAAQLGSLIPPESFAVSAGPDHISVSVSWTNPTQPTIDADRVQIRLAELGAVWVDVEMPLAAWSWSALDPATTYTAQIRYVADDLGVPTHYSTIEHVEFTTSAAPVGPPAEDPGGTGGETTVPISPSAGGFPGGATAPSTSDGCWIEYKIEMLSQVAYTYESGALDILTSDDGVTAIAGETNGDADSIEFDMASLTQGRVHRLCWRSACDTNSDSIADDFGDWNCGAPFPVGTDWDTACAGIPDSTGITGLTVEDDVAYRYPRFCLNPDTGAGLVMIEAESNVEIGRGPGFFGFFTDSDSEQGATPLPTITSFPFYPVMVAPLGALLTMLQVGNDWTIVSSFRAKTAFTGSNGRSWTLGAYAGGAVNVTITESATGWTPSAAILSTAGITSLTGTEIPYDDGVTHRISVRWDDDGNATLYQDDASGDTEDVSLVDLYENATSEAGVNAAPADIALMQQMGWARALSDVELDTLYAPQDPGVATAEWHVDFSDSDSYTASGGAISAVHDLTLQQSDLTQATAADKPTLVGSVARFDGSTDHVTVSGAGADVFSDGSVGGKTFIIVMAWTGTTTSRYWLGATSTASTTPIWAFLGVNTNGADPAIFTRQTLPGDNLIFFDEAAGTYDGSLHVYAYRMGWPNPTDVQLSVDGGAADLFSDDPEYFASTQLTMGGLIRAGGSLELAAACDVGEIRYWDTLLSDSDVAAHVAFLKSKWGI